MSYLKVKYHLHTKSPQEAIDKLENEGLYIDKVTKDGAYYRIDYYHLHELLKR